MIAPAKLRQILELRRSTRVPPLLPPKKGSKKGADEAKKGSNNQHKEILDIHVQLRNFGAAQQTMAGPIACAFSESESGNQRGPWRVTTANELLGKDSSVELPNVFAVEFQLENAAKYIRLDICDLFAKKVLSVGYCVFSVSELVSARGDKIQRKVMDDESGTQIADALIFCTFRAKPHAVVLQFVAKSLSKKHLTNASSANVFFEIHRMSSDVAEEMDAMAICNDDDAAGTASASTAATDNYTASDGSAIGVDGSSPPVPSPKGSLLYRSESIKWHSSRLLWRAFTLQSTDIVRRELRLICFQRNSAKSPAVPPPPPVSLGEFPLFYSVLRRGPSPENVYFLVYENSRHQKKNGGTFELCRLHEVCTPSFLEYISAGTSLNLAFAIDFSRSGIFVDEQLVKHYIEDVELLIGAFGGALRDFNSSNSYPAFGFGAKIPPQFRESQEFCLNLDGTDPYCRGVSGVFSAFKSSFTKVEPLNMAHLSHVIYYMAKLAQNSLCRLTPANNCVEELGSEGKPPNYFVLVIVTRGIFDDLKETVQSLIFASRAPLSIVFVGIGEDEQHLGELERLATAGTRLNFHGRKPERDYTQYVSVPLCRKEESKTNDLKIAVVERGLSAVSAQMCNWMMRNGYQKLEPVPETGTIQQRHQPFPQQQCQQQVSVDCAQPPPTSAAHAPSFEDNGGDAWPSDGSCRTPTPFRHGIRMRQSAQCLSLGRSSSSSSFGSFNKLFGGGIYSSAPESALEITSAVAGPTVPDWPLDGTNRNLESANCSVQQQQHQPAPASNSACLSRLPKTFQNLKKWVKKNELDPGGGVGGAGGGGGEAGGGEGVVSAAAARHLTTTAKEGKEELLTVTSMPTSSSCPSSTAGPCQCPPSSAITPSQQQ